MSKKPLAGLTVIAIEQAVAAPLCTVRLADAGARVIKIERQGGETARHYDSTVDGTSAYFAWLNRGKQSAVLDLKDSEDLSLLDKMLAKADVLVQNLSPGAMGRMGLTAEKLAQSFPHLIVVSIVGYGQDTSYANMKAYDLLLQAESGLCAITGPPDAPSKLGVSAIDIATGMNAHAAVLEALIARGQTGAGQIIEIAMFDGIADWMSVPLLHLEYANNETLRHGMAHASIYPYGPFQCADGTILIAVQTQAEWKSLCEMVWDRADLVEDERFACNPARSDNRALLDAEIDPIFAQHTLQEMIEKLEAARIAYGHYNDMAGLSSHPALRRIDVALPNGSTISLPRPAGREDDFAASPISLLGEHTMAIRDEFE